MTIVSDNTGGDVAYAATFNLEEDIYYVRIPPSAAPAQRSGQHQHPQLCSNRRACDDWRFYCSRYGRKSVIIRAIGPELTQFGINDALANPRLEFTTAPER